MANNKTPGYQFTIFDAIGQNTDKKNKTQQLQAAISAIEQKYNDQISHKQREIQSLRNSDPDDMDTETRNDINSLCSDIRFLEQACQDDIAKFLAQHPEMQKPR